MRLRQMMRIRAQALKGMPPMCPLQLCGWMRVCRLGTRCQWRISLCRPWPAPPWPLRPHMPRHTCAQGRRMGQRLQHRARQGLRCVRPKCQGLQRTKTCLRRTDRPQTRSYREWRPPSLSWRCSASAFGIGRPVPQAQSAVLRKRPVMRMTRSGDGLCGGYGGTQPAGGGHLGWGARVSRGCDTDFILLGGAGRGGGLLGAVLTTYELQTPAVLRKVQWEDWWLIK